MKTLTIRLSSPLQSFGNEASFDQRTSWQCPSKSAVIGMLAAALGYQRNDERIHNLKKLAFAVRIDQPGQLMIDYQTIKWNAKKAGTKITKKHYLQDAVFMVALASENEALILSLKQALCHPKFQLFFGRHANVPAGPLKITITDDLNPVQTLKSLEWQAADWFQKKTNQQVINIELIADANLLPEDTANLKLIKDNVISFDQRNRQMSFRAVSSTYIQLVNKKFAKQPVGTKHDIMNFL